MKQQSVIQPETRHLKQYLSGFRALRVKFTLFPLEDIHLGPDEVKGDRWRGGFGEALRNLACLYRWEKNDCNQCKTSEDCLYHRYFFTDKPHPYVMLPELDGKRGYHEGDRMFLEMVLIGEATGQSDKFVTTVEEMGRTGIGSRRGRFRLKSVVTEDLFGDYECLEEKTVTVDHCTIELLTPLKIKEGNSGLKYRNLTFETFFRLLIKRIINLNNLYCNGRSFDRERIEPEKRDLFKLARKIEAKTYTEWRDFKRFSSRQHKSLKIGGQLGIIMYNGDMAPFYPYLKLGEIVGVGQHTTSGFGRYRLRSGNMR